MNHREMPDPNDLRVHLARFPLFGALDQADLDRLAARFQRRSVPAGRTLFFQGDQGAELFLLLSGSVRIVLAHPGGRDVTLALLSAGEFFGDMALLDGHPRSASAITVEACEVLVLRQADFFAVLDGSPNSARRLLAFLSERLRRANERLQDVALLKVRQRLAGLLRELALRQGESNEVGILLPREVNHPFLAQTLSTSRERVTREMSEFRSHGLVAQEGRRIRVLNAEGLRRVVEGEP